MIIHFKVKENRGSPKVIANLKPVELNHLPSGWSILRMNFAEKVTSPLILKVRYVRELGVHETHYRIRGRGRKASVLFRLPRNAQEVSLEYLPGIPSQRLQEAAVTTRTHAQVALSVVFSVVLKVLAHPRTLFTSIAILIAAVRKKGLKEIQTLIRREALHRIPTLEEDYNYWAGLYDELSEKDRKRIHYKLKKLDHQPLLSILIAGDRDDESFERTLASLDQQLYPKWEVGLLSKSKSSLPKLRGKFFAVVASGDELPPQALYSVVEEINRFPEAEVIYTDEDIKDSSGRRDPWFKPDWDPIYFSSSDYLSHLCVFKTSLLKKKELPEFSESYADRLARQLVVEVAPNHIRHIPHILYHSHTSTEFRNLRIYDPARDALAKHHGRFPLPETLPTVSIIICTKDKLTLLRGIVEGILHQTDYPKSKVELFIVDNQSSEQATLEYFKELTAKKQAHVLSYDAPFNFSAMNNFAARHAKGEILAFLNNDLLVIDQGWLKELVRVAHRKEIGAVGVKLYYPDDTIQHAGVVVGIEGVAAHVHKFLPRDADGYMFRAKKPQCLSVVTAACMAVKKSDFDEVGGFDAKHLAVAFNDVDLCLRLQEKDLLNVWTPYAELYHLESASRGQDLEPAKRARFESEVHFMRTRWKDVLFKDPYYNPNLTLAGDNMGLSFPPRRPHAWNERFRKR